MEALAIEESGLKAEFKKNPEPVPYELKKMSVKKPQLKKVFSSLTSGRQRAYIFHFSGAKNPRQGSLALKSVLPFF